MSRFRLLPRLVVDSRLATVLLALAATLLPVALVAAATSPLGFTLGQTTLAEVERLLPRFRDVVDDLHAKYSVDRESIDNFMQYGEALFRSGDDWIYYAINAWWPEMARSIEEHKAKKRQQERGKL